jgi:hypothetical protein
VCSSDLPTQQQKNYPKQPHALTVATNHITNINRQIVVVAIYNVTDAGRRVLNTPPAINNCTTNIQLLDTTLSQLKRKLDFTMFLKKTKKQEKII